jgi:hypothetical protein
LRDHFERAAPTAASPATQELARALGIASMAKDWRSAQRSVQVLGRLPAQVSAPLLIEALSTWVSRAERNEPSKRVQGEIVNALRRLSGRNIGPYPERWSAWWKSGRAGKGASPPTHDEEEPRTVAAGFFGLRPMTDRVLFVLDRSGSMKSSFGTGRKSRHEEALTQLLVLLRELGPSARFGVILFSDETQRWHSKLVPASQGNMVAVTEWIRSLPPNGGTFLRPAIAEALELRPGNVVELEKLEADTVIVLCDGATGEGPGWVEPLLTAVNETACVRFDCVQIGGGGDGTLQLLSRASGGDYVEVNP